MRVAFNLTVAATILLPAAAGAAAESGRLHTCAS